MRPLGETARNCIRSAIIMRCWLGVALILAATVEAQAEPCSLSVGWEPYGTRIYVDAEGAVTGSDIELMRTLAEEIGCSITFKPLPWPRHLLELKAGLIDVATSAGTPNARISVGFPTSTGSTKWPCTCCAARSETTGCRGWRRCPKPASSLVSSVATIMGRSSRALIPTRLRAADRSCSRLCHQHPQTDPWSRDSVLADDVTAAMEAAKALLASGNASNDIRLPSQQCLPIVVQ